MEPFKVVWLDQVSLTYHFIIAQKKTIEMTCENWFIWCLNSPFWSLFELGRRRSWTDHLWSTGSADPVEPGVYAHIHARLFLWINTILIGFALVLNNYSDKLAQLDVSTSPKARSLSCGTPARCPVTGTGGAMSEKTFTFFKNYRKCTVWISKHSAWWQ